MATYYVGSMPCSSELYHYGVKGMKWGKHLFGLAEDIGRYVRGTAKQIKGQITGNSATAGIGKAMVSNARRSVGRNVSGLREAASNTAYNARQFLTGSEDRRKMNDARAQAEKLRKAGRFREALKYEDQAKQAQKEYESMTLPGMAEKTYRRVSKALGLTGSQIKDLYNNVRQRVSGAMANIANGAGNAASWILSGWATIKEKVKGAIFRAPSWSFNEVQQEIDYNVPYFGSADDGFDPNSGHTSSSSTATANNTQDIEEGNQNATAPSYPQSPENAIREKEKQRAGFHYPAEQYTTYKPDGSTETHRVRGHRKKDPNARRKH